ANRRNNEAISTRIRVPDRLICLDDRIQGKYCQNLATDIGDFTLLRRDGLYSYHLAVTVDDAWQNITHSVRGVDLLDSTPRQLYLQELLDLPAPAYAHLPVAINHNGQKLSKQSRAAPLSRQHAGRQLWQALRFLGQEPPDELKTGSPAELWIWAGKHWSMNRVPRVDGIEVPETPLDASG
ncbi:MAG TPA: glutamate--tRNA ligase family protein, partial [Gammaproteobacteria bacterium]